jgi:hypothetical protein
LVETTADQDGKRVRVLTWKSVDGSTVEIRSERTLGSDGTNLLPIDRGYRTERRDLIRTTDPNGQVVTRRLYLSYEFTERRGGMTGVRRILAADNVGERWWQRVRPEMAAQKRLEEGLDDSAGRCEAEIAPGLEEPRPRPGRILRLAQGGGILVAIGVILYSTIHALTGHSKPSNEPAIQLRACHPPAVVGTVSVASVALIGGDQTFQIAWTINGIPDDTDRVTRASSFDADHAPVSAYRLTLVPTDVAEEVSVSVVGGNWKWQEPVMGPHTICPIQPIGQSTRRPASAEGHRIGYRTRTARSPTMAPYLASIRAMASRRR